MQKLCLYCKKKIYDELYVQVIENKFFHLSHFKCCSCKKSLKNEENIREQDSKAYCNDCFFTKITKICQTCKKPIEGEYYEAFDICYHKEHFCCSKCGEKLSENFLRMDGDVVCMMCYKGRGARCEKCKGTIDGKRTIVDDRVWHENCFCCKVCNKPIEKGKFIFYGEDCYHAGCYRELGMVNCAFCKSSIENEYLEHKQSGDKLHKGCIELYKNMQAF